MENVTITVDGRGVATVAIDRPEKHNAFNAEVLADLQAAFRQVGADPAVRLVVLRGNGKSFSAGADANWLKASIALSHDRNVADALEIARMLHALDVLPKPTVALVHGATMGGGVGLVAACDIAFASADAFFSLSEVKLGLIPAAISPYVVAAVGRRAARRYFLTAERFDAAVACRMGLVSEVVADAAGLDAAAEGVARHVLAAGPEALAACKDLIRTVTARTIDDELMAETARRIAARRTSAEGQEGLTAFLERRKPRWVVE